tara:strand:- start:1747 stop:2100 length:354 start_codon:yes stop_codon:yes gene_type:complete
MAKAVCITENPVQLVVVLNELSQKAEKSYIWMHELEAACKKAGFVFGAYFMEGGEDNYLRRVRLCVNKGRNIIILNLMKKHGIDKEQATSRLDEKTFVRIEQVPEMEDVGSIMDALG